MMGGTSRLKPLHRVVVSMTSHTFKEKEEANFALRGGVCEACDVLSSLSPECLAEMCWYRKMKLFACVKQNVMWPLT